MANFPDGTPRPNATSGVGGVAPNGQALRHTPDTEPAAQNFGWLDGVKGVIGGPNRAANVGVNIGPSSNLWRKATPTPLTTGKQGKGRKR